MVKKLLVTLVVLLLTCLLFSLAAAEGNGADRTVVDMKGKTIILPESIDSYCVLYSSAVPFCAMMDENLQHMVLYPVSNYFEYWYTLMFEGINDHALQVDKKNVTAEQILESGAQVVFWNRAAHEELIASLEAAGIACVNVQITNSEDLLRTIHVIADTFGTEFAQEKAQAYDEKYHIYLKSAIEHANQIPDDEKKTVLVIGSVDNPTVGAIDSYQGYWTNLTGLINLTPVKAGEPQSTLTMEEIYEIDPDIIIAQGPFNRDNINNDTNWKEVRAVKENMLFSNPSVLDEWGMPTSEAPLQFIWVLKQFYSQYAEDIDASAELISFYKDFYNYEITQEKADAILSCHHFYLHPALQEME